MSMMFVFLIGFTLVITPTYADWAKSFVVFNGNSYSVTDTEVEQDRVGSQIGKVTKYSDEEGTYRGNFSNYFPKGTTYYQIKDLEAAKAIAVKNSDGKFIRVDYDGKYPGEIIRWKPILAYMFGSFLLIIVFLLLQNNLKRK